MATVDDLLTRVHRQAAGLHPTGQPVRQLNAHLRGWVPLANNAWRILEALDPRPGQDPELYGLLHSLSRGPASQPGHAVDAGVTALTLTLGVLGDVVASSPTVVAEAGQAQRSRLQASIRAALHAAARATFDVARAAGREREATIVWKVAEVTELAALLPPMARVSTLERLTVTRPTPDTVDGAVQLWVDAAEATFTNYQLLTGVALQEAAATLALLARITADTLHEAARLRTVEPEVGREAARLMTEAASAWRIAATWPSNVQLGGRAYEHHQAARTVRDALTGSPLSWLTPREKVRTLGTAANMAVTIGNLQAEAVTWLVNRGGLWVAHERANLRPPGVERRHVKLDWSLLPSDHPAGALLTLRAHEACIALRRAAAVVNQAVLPAAVGSGDGQLALVDHRIVWEIIDPTTSVRRPAGPTASPEAERRPRVAR